MLKKLLFNFPFSGILFVSLTLSAEEVFHFNAMDELHQKVCTQAQIENNPWNLAYLYDCEKKMLFIPYQLWTGERWDGDKNADCMHKANHFFSVNNRTKTLITGQHEWNNPIVNKTEFYWERKRLDKYKIQYFTCHEKGIGRVYDSRGERYYESGRCKFPAGYSWQLAEREYCNDTSIELTAIGLDQNNNLAFIDFKWWYKSWGKYTLDYIYRYVPNYGMKDAWKQ